MLLADGHAGGTRHTGGLQLDGESKLRIQLLGYMLIPPLQLVAADRGYLRADLWREVRDTGTQLLWGIPKSVNLPSHDLPPGPGGLLSGVLRN